MLKAGDEHALQLRFVLGSHHCEVGNGSHVADVVLALVGGAIGTDDAGTIQNKGDGKLLNADVMNQLIEGALQEGAVDRHHRLEPFAGHASREGHCVLLSDSHIHVLGRYGFLQKIETRTRRHRSGDADNPAVLLTEFDQGLTEHLAVARRFRRLGGDGLAGVQVEGRLGVISNLIRFGIGIPLALFGDDMHQDRTALAVGGLEGSHHGPDVVTIDRTHVGEAKLLEHSADLGDGEASHAALQSVQLVGQLSSHEGKIAHALLNASGEELHRRAEASPVQRMRQGSHRR
ncbi:MAG: Uncharacterised protein [Synechococcus sp. CC9902]|nr:MAG: Uncharacterised protein [Synechococcus sp. CC9902]